MTRRSGHPAHDATASGGTEHTSTAAAQWSTTVAQWRPGRHGYGGACPKSRGPPASRSLGEARDVRRGAGRCRGETASAPDSWHLGCDIGSKIPAVAMARAVRRSKAGSSSRPTRKRKNVGVVEDSDGVVEDSDSGVSEVRRQVWRMRSSRGHRCRLGRAHSRHRRRHRASRDQDKRERKEREEERWRANMWAQGHF
ncbi:hypothetical protein [Oryza sativa Japonica Group]|uniref:Uncharacterized protein P0436D06.37 n=1 Tax=Oryza sativa subsp. japonica TaxID=39947 RepID=Q5QN78_ORYSJ|nr:hypothetical protein [Oryza sativa Japonica Group]